MSTGALPAGGPVTPAAPLSGLGRFRWRICALIFCANAINYIDRQVLGLLAPDLEKQFGWSEVEYGYVVTAFQAAFAIGYVSFGWFVDRFGTKIGYAVSIVLWSVAAIGHGWARSIVGFGVARAALGLGESGSTPAAIKAFAEYFPKQERALATGIFNGGSSLGAVLAPLIVPLLAIQFGWASAFFVTGALGLVWLGFWLYLYEVPERQPRLTPAELAYIRSDTAETTTHQIRWASLLRYRTTWAFVLVKFLTDPIFWFYLYWLPKFLAKQYGLNITTSMGPLVTIYAMVALGGVAGGWVSSSLLRRGWSVNRGRKAVLLGSALCIVPIVSVAFVHNLWLTVLLIGLAAAAHQSWSAVFFTTVADQYPKRAVSSVIGLGGMAGAVGGMLVATATGYLLDLTGSYLPVFAVAAVVYLLTLGVYQRMVPIIKPIAFPADAPLS